MRHASRATLECAVLALVALTLSLAPGLAAADWPQFGRAITTAPKGQTHPDITTDGADGAVITWQDGRAPRVNIFAQHVFAAGNVDAAWPVDGRALLRDSLAIATAAGGQSAPLIVSDGAGGGIVAWQDLRSSITEFDIYAQHILASGNVDPAWPANGRALCEIAGEQNTHAIATDGAGGAIVAWKDTRPGASVADIFAQHVLASGLVDPQWPVNGLAVSTASGLQESPAIVGDGAGGAFITWDDGRSAATDLDVYVQHVMATGVADPAWPVDGRAVCSATGAQGHPTVIADGVGGVIIAWTDSRIVGTAHIFAQHALRSGVVDPVWPANGRAVSNAALAESRPVAVPDGAGGAIVSWQGFTTQLNMYAQHVRATGTLDPNWPPNGLALSDSDRQQSDAAIASDGSGGAIVAWQDGPRIVAQHILISGVFDPTYPATGRPVADLPSPQGDPALVATAGSGAIVTWVDGRSDVDIFAMQVLQATPVDVPGTTSPPAITFAPGQNPARGSLTLRYVLPRDASVRLAIYDINGRRVRDLVSRAELAGVHAIDWDLRDERGDAVGGGVFFARLEVERRAFVQKLAALR